MSGVGFHSLTMLLKKIKKAKSIHYTTHLWVYVDNIWFSLFSRKICFGKILLHLIQNVITELMLKQNLLSWTFINKSYREKWRTGELNLRHVVMVAEGHSFLDFNK